MNIYVGNLPYDFTEEELIEMFNQFGNVANVKIITDKVSGRSKGFGFIEMEQKSEGKDAIQVLDQSPVRGRNVRVHAARPKNGRQQRNKSKRSKDTESNAIEVQVAASAGGKKEDAAIG